jgi:hypothetical protein
MFPSSLTDLHLNIRLSAPLLPGVLPPSLTTLNLTIHHPIPAGVLPLQLTSCTLCDPFDFSPSRAPFLPDLHSFPSSLTHLTITSSLLIVSRAPLVPGVLPSSLTVLELGCGEWFIEEKDAMPPSLVETGLNRFSCFFQVVSPPASV